MQASGSANPTTPQPHATTPDAEDVDFPFTDDVDELSTADGRVSVEGALLDALGGHAYLGPASILRNGQALADPSEQEACHLWQLQAYEELDKDPFLDNETWSVLANRIIDEAIRLHRHKPPLVVGSDDLPAVDDTLTCFARLFQIAKALHYFPCIKQRIMSESDAETLNRLIADPFGVQEEALAKFFEALDAGKYPFSQSGTNWWVTQTQAAIEGRPWAFAIEGFYGETVDWEDRVVVDGVIRTSMTWRISGRVSDEDYQEMEGA